MEIGDDYYEKLQINDSEKMAITGGELNALESRLLDVLYSSEFPRPQQLVDSKRTYARIEAWMAAYIKLLDEFLNGLSAWQGAPIALWDKNKGPCY